MTDRALLPFGALPPRATYAKGARSGRESKKNPALVEHLLTLLETGNTRKTACDAVGVSTATFYNWITSDEKFLESVLRAESQSHLESVQRIRAAARGGEVIKHIIKTKRNRDGSEEVTEEIEFSQPNVQADMWYLERKFPDQWGRRDRVSHEVVSDAARKIGNALGIDPSELLARATALAEEEELNSVPEREHAEPNTGQ